jgi:cellulose synthase/poly-beta-1,6-N-acetylglucosamine synthase-like glycosyltransferase
MFDKSQFITILIPCYNEENAIAGVIRSVEQAMRISKKTGVAEGIRVVHFWYSSSSSSMVLVLAPMASLQ